MQGRFCISLVAWMEIETIERLASFRMQTSAQYLLDSIFEYEVAMGVTTKINTP